MKNYLLEEDIETIINNLGAEIFKFENKNIIISGAFGFIGKYILEFLIFIKEKEKINFTVYAIDNFITSDKLIKDYFNSKGINCIEHDINKSLHLDVEFDIIICLAGIASPYYYNKYPIETLTVAIDGLKNMFKVKHNKNSKFIFFSSSEIYGDPPPEKIPTKEDFRGNVTPVGPRSCYDESKRIGETLCYINSNLYRKKTAIIRPFNVFGPGMQIRDYRIIPNIMRSLIFGEQFKIFNTGKQTRTYCYITDAVSGFLKIFLKKELFGIYNIGNDSGEISVVDLVKMTEKIMNIKLNYSMSGYPKEYPPDEPMRRCPDITNASINLGYVPKISLKTGLLKHFNWAKQFIKN